jgi:hypothetical protein
MALERIVRECLADIAARHEVPVAAARRLDALAGAMADGEIDPLTDRAELSRRIDFILKGFDAE